MPVKADEDIESSFITYIDRGMTKSYCTPEHLSLVMGSSVFSRAEKFETLCGYLKDRHRKLELDIIYPESRSMNIDAEMKRLNQGVYEEMDELLDEVNDHLKDIGLEMIYFQMPGAFGNFPRISASEFSYKEPYIDYQGKVSEQTEFGVSRFLDKVSDTEDLSVKDAQDWMRTNRKVIEKNGAYLMSNHGLTGDGYITFSLRFGIVDKTVYDLVCLLNDTVGETLNAYNAANEVIHIYKISEVLELISEGRGVEAGYMISEDNLFPGLMENIKKGDDLTQRIIEEVGHETMLYVMRMMNHMGNSDLIDSLIGKYNLDIILDHYEFGSIFEQMNMIWEREIFTQPQLTT